MEQIKDDPLAEKLLGILSKHLKLVDNAYAIPMEQRLDELGLDSIGAINLLLDLEDNFTISFPDFMLTEETFRTPATLYKAVYALTNNHH
jgi:acyl carrier protein